MTSAATTGAACSDGVMSMVDPPADAGASDVPRVTDRGPRDGGFAVPDVPEDADEPYLELDGGLGDPVRRGWQPGSAAGTDVGAVDEYAVSTWRYNPGARAIVVRDARGFYAYSAICSHEGCIIGIPDATGNSVCPCHSSRFDGNGRVTMGPAVRALARYAVHVVDDRVIVDRATRVADDVRAAPPVDAGVLDAGSDRPAPADTGPRDVPVDTGVDVNYCVMGAEVGPVSMFPVNTWRMFRQGFIVARDARGLYAYSSSCTHNGCTIGNPDPATGATECGCHGSRFDGVGRVMRGPARDPLDHYAVRVCAGMVRVDSSVVVPEGDRTAVQ